jgi:hypothetical protein
MKTSRLTWALAVAGLIVSQSACLAITVVVNGQTLPAQPPAVERSGRVLLPMRVVFEALQATVGWNAATRTASAVRGDTTVTMTIDSSTAFVNGAPVTLDVPAQLIGGRTYVPVRFPAEAFGADVGWTQATQTVTISLAGLPGQPPPAGGQAGAPIVYAPRNGDLVGTRTEVSIQSTPGVMQVIWTEVKRTDTGEVLRSVPGIRHLTKADGSYSGAIATPRIAIGDEGVQLRYEIHFRNGPNEGDPVTVVTCYPDD